MRYSLEKDYAVSMEVLKDRVKSDVFTKSLFNGIHRFIKEDYLVIKSDMSKSQINKISKEIAYKVIQRSNSWSALVSNIFPNAFRLSIHPQSIDSEKFPVKLLPCHEHWGTPWHRVAVMKNGKLELMRSKDVKRLGGQLKKYLGQYVYFDLGVMA